MTTTKALQALFDYLGDDRWDLGELIYSACQGNEIANSRTAELLQDLFESMPNCDDLTIEQIITNIQAVGSEFALGVANDVKVEMQGGPMEHPDPYAGNPHGELQSIVDHAERSCGDEDWGW